MAGKKLMHGWRALSHILVIQAQQADPKGAFLVCQCLMGRSPEMALQHSTSSSSTMQDHRIWLSSMHTAHVLPLQCACAGMVVTICSARWSMCNLWQPWAHQVAAVPLSQTDCCATSTYWRVRR